MSLIKWWIAALAAVQGGYMLFDGCRALVTGSYLMPRTGAHAGQLGPWARVVEAVGIAPESNGMRVAFLLFGAAWITTAAAIAVETAWIWWPAAILAAATLWYLVPGTVISLLVLALLIAPHMRQALGGP